jgi:hypothetical protein
MPANNHITRGPGATRAKPKKRQAPNLGQRVHAAVMSGQGLDAALAKEIDEAGELHITLAHIEDLIDRSETQLAGYERVLRALKGHADKLASALLTETATTYLDRLPMSVPEGMVLVHNSVRPSRQQGERGARYWLQAPNDRLVVCVCAWARELGRHYRVEV